MNYKNYFSYFKNNSNEIYFDSAATSIKFDEVIKAHSDYDLLYAANSHNDLFKNAFFSNQMLLETRKKVATFINAKNENEVVFTSGTTHSLNQLAFGISNLIDNNSKILLTKLEHASNLLPWIVVAEQKNACIEFLDLDSEYKIDIDKIKNKLDSSVKVVSFAMNSNTIGISNDVELITKLIKSYNKNIIVIVDLAQSIIHNKIDVSKWNVDGVAFSTHKMFGPFGLGVLWAKENLLNELKPIFYGGGNNIDISNNSYKLAKPPHKFESGTLNLSAIYAFNKCLDVINEIGINKIIEYPKSLKQYFRANIDDSIIKKFNFYNLDNDQPILLFNLLNVNAQDFGAFLNKKYNISVRVGKHCARLTSDLLNAHSTIRLSFSIYNTYEDIDKLIIALKDSDSWVNEII
ncbi:cysteine desulfurase [Spiroplasma turonicum]|nr:aminotransferase class V-fold PLP-dependent enzyme [Spiroplasma turonicum]ALX70484.1 cysteine desulfurase [Spiroplasma turonicum]